MVPQWVIEKKRDGQALDEAEVRSFIEQYARGAIPDYQMAALAMAIYFRGMTLEETTVLTDAMMRSGVILNTAGIAAPKADKHSTGGIGDKVSLILAPLVASCGVAVPMVSGRGLGITGGTLDKLESIPGYRTDLDPDAFLAVVRECGCSIVGQTAQLAPADRKLYALRDVTGTVPSIPLISASIMSKKLAEGLDALVLDVKCGQGAFMKTPAQARELARTMVEIGTRMGTRTVALVTDMSQPLGRTAGNVLEVVEAIETLQGKGPEDLVEATLELGAQVLVLSGKASNRATALSELRRRLSGGEAFGKFCEMVRRHGGDVRAVEEPGRLPAAALRREVPAPGAGFVTQASAEALGRACVLLGAGRTRVEDRVDPAVGVSGIAKIGESVLKGQPLAVLHASDRVRMADAFRIALRAFEVAPRAIRPPPLIMDAVRAHGGGVTPRGKALQRTAASQDAARAGTDGTRRRTGARRS